MQKTGAYEYEQMKKQVLRGWNTWNTWSILSHTHLPGRIYHNSA